MWQSVVEFLAITSKGDVRKERRPDKI